MRRSTFITIACLVASAAAGPLACRVGEALTTAAPDINRQWVGCTDDEAVCLALVLDGTDSTRVWGTGLVATKDGATHSMTVTGGFDNHDTGLVALAICPNPERLHTLPIPDCYVLRGSVRVERIFGALYGNGLAERHIILAPPVQT